MDIKIKEVQSRKELKNFIRFPTRLYSNNPYWVPPLFIDEYNTLRQDKNPSFDHCEAKYWLAYKQGKIAGRIAGIINHQHLKKWQQKYMRFGWIDFVDDITVSEALLKSVESWALEKEMGAVHGPLGFTDFDHEGMLIEGFEELGTLATIYNYSYYPNHMEKMGYKKDTDWIEFELSVPSLPNEKIARIVDIVLRRYNLKILKAENKKELLPYVGELFQLINETYQHLYGVVPLTDNQIKTYTKQYFGFIKPEFVPIVLDQNNHMVAFGITMPSLSRALQKSGGKLFPFGFLYLLQALRKNDRADLYLVAVKPEYQGKGVNAILIHMMNEVYNQLEITKVESNPELETNLLVQKQWKYFDKRQHKRRRCFIKHL